MFAGILGVTAASIVSAAPPAGDASARPASVIGTHQIDRHAAIDRLQARLKENPKALADWIILGELAHEVAVDSPSTQSARYYTLSRQAYERALALAPDNPGLKAAVQFARDYEEGAARFATIRDRATSTYLEARRRDLAATNYVPAVRVYPALPAPSAVPPVSPTSLPVAAAAGAPTVAPAGALPGDPAPAVNPPPTNTASTDVANFGVRQIYSSPYAYYQPYAPPKGDPYTFQEYRSAYYPPNLDTDAGPLPVTLQRYAIQRRLDANERPVSGASTAPRGGTTP
jgi:hypothetical protein